MRDPGPVAIQIQRRRDELPQFVPMERQRQKRQVHREQQRREREKEDQMGRTTGKHTPAY